MLYFGSVRILTTALSLADERVSHVLGQEMNHPANIAAVYEAAAESLGHPPEDLVKRVEENFVRLFGG